MDLASIIIIAMALAMDAFSVCISCGMIIARPGFGIISGWPSISACSSS